MRTNKQAIKAFKKKCASNYLPSAITNSPTNTTATFINKAKNIHGNKYDYSKVKYINSKTKVIIICPIHGQFIISPNSHINGQGCPLC